MTDQLWIKAVLKSRGHKLKDVAEALKITPPRVSDIIKGMREVQADEILPLAGLLGLSATNLLRSLEVGDLIATIGSESAARLPVEGQLTGGGDILPLDADFPFDNIAVPPDAKSAQGLHCYIMGDDSLGQEIHKGSLIIAADPRQHFVPIVPGTIFLIEMNKEILVPRLYHRTSSGGDWLITCPPKPNPAFRNFAFQTNPAEDTKEMPYDCVTIDQIKAGILWVHRRFT